MFVTEHKKCKFLKFSWFLLIIYQLWDFLDEILDWIVLSTNKDNVDK